MTDSPLFELQGVEVSGAGGKRLLSGIGFSLPAGSWSAVSGPSGSGKSTLLKVLSLLLRPSAGSLFIQGAPPERHSVTALRRRLPLVMQEPVLLGRTVREDLAEAFSFAAAEGAAPPAGERLDTLLDAVELPSDILDRDSARLSGGEKQRVAIARALALEPQAVLLDEPTSALDLVTAERVFDNLSRIWPGLNLVLVTHSKPLIDRTVTQFLLRGGRLERVAHGLTDSELRQFLEVRQ
ncbi:ATP-binding cassette domain-containing protein [bacterium]|nr:ATP-binding cassette domain-containing protein [bacterium]